MKNFFVKEGKTIKEVSVKKLEFAYEDKNDAVVLVRYAHRGSEGYVTTRHKCGSKVFDETINLFHDKECKSMATPISLNLDLAHAQLQKKAYWSTLTLAYNNGATHQRSIPLVLIGKEQPIVLRTFEEMRNIRISEIEYDEYGRAVATKLLYNGHSYDRAMPYANYALETPTKVLYENGDEETLPSDAERTTLTEEQLRIVGELHDVIERLNNAGVAVLYSEECANLIAINTEGKKLSVEFESMEGKKELNLEVSCEVVHGFKRFLDDNYVYLD